MTNQKTTEEKIKEIVAEGLSRGVFHNDDPNGFRQQWLYDKLQEFRQQTLEEAMEHVANKRTTVNYANSHDAIMHSDYDYGFNDCRQQTLSNLQKLKDN